VGVWQRDGANSNLVVWVAWLARYDPQRLVDLVAWEATLAFTQPLLHVAMQVLTRDFKEILGLRLGLALALGWRTSQERK
jgi:hypothetical protein